MVQVGISFQSVVSKVPSDSLCNCPKILDLNLRNDTIGRNLPENSLYSRSLNFTAIKMTNERPIEQAEWRSRPIAAPRITRTIYHLAGRSGQVLDNLTGMLNSQTYSTRIRYAAIEIPGHGFTPRSCTFILR